MEINATLEHYSWEFKVHMSVEDVFYSGLQQNETSLEKYFKWKPVDTVPTPPSCSGDSGTADPAAQDPGQSFCLEHDICKANKTSVCVWCDWACDSVLWMICTGLVSMMLTDLKQAIRWAELNNVTILFLFKISQIPIKKHVIVHINNSNLCISGESQCCLSCLWAGEFSQCSQ